MRPPARTGRVAATGGVGAGRQARPRPVSASACKADRREISPLRVIISSSSDVPERARKGNAPDVEKHLRTCRHAVGVGGAKTAVRSLLHSLRSREVAPRKWVTRVIQPLRRGGQAMPESAYVPVRPAPRPSRRGSPAASAASPRHRPIVVEPREERLDSTFCDILQRLRNAGQRRVHAAGEHIVVADHAHLLRNADPRLVGGPHHAEGKHIGAAEHRGRRSPEGQQGLQGADTGIEPVILQPDEPVRKRQALRANRGDERIEPAAVGPCLEALPT